MHEEIVSPSGGNREALWLLAVAVLVVALTGAGVNMRMRGSEEQRLSANQISGFNDLVPAEQGLFSDLYSAGFEIDGMHDDSEGWPTVSDLEDSYVPPFVRDTSWGRRGRLAWSMRSLRIGESHGALYVGRPGDNAFGAFAVMLLHAHEGGRVHMASDAEHEKKPFSIWRHDREGADLPRVVDERQLARAGWKEVVPYLGDSEKERITGGRRS